MQRPSVALLTVAAGLFAAWIVYLAYLALTASHPVVLSRPQLLVANLWVIADVDGTDGPVTVSEVVWAEKPVMAAAPKAGTVIEVKNLAESKKDWTGKSRYIIPLLKDGDNYRVAPIPRSPGFGSGPPRIYPDTAETRDQLHALRDRMPPS